MILAWYNKRIYTILLRTCKYIFRTIAGAEWIRHSVDKGNQEKMRQKNRKVHPILVTIKTRI